MTTDFVRIDRHYCGPPNSGNGGYTCGLTASRLEGTVRVRLKAPPPLDTDLRLETGADEARLLHGETLVAEAKRAELDLEVPRSPSFVAAELASRSYIGFQHHTFPTCFVCGPKRNEGEGLRIFPGPVHDSDAIAAPWTPDESLSDGSGRVKRLFVWASLDCPGAFVFYPLAEGVAIVLGELTASIQTAVAPGERCVVMGWPLGSEGRKRFSGTAVHGPDGRLIAKARAVWIEVPGGAWNAA